MDTTKNCFCANNDEIVVFRFFSLFLVPKGVLFFSLWESPARVSIILKAPLAMYYSLRLDLDFNSFPFGVC